jgi:AAA+ ATPase superfamily predicted ATPase
MDMPSVGGPARGTDFFNRKKEVHEILNSLEKDNVLLISPRRYGKTSIMMEVEKELRERGNVCFFLDVMSIDEPEEFIVELADAFFAEAKTEMRRKLLNALKGVFSRIEEIEAGTQGVRVKFKDLLIKEVKSETWARDGSEIFRALTKTHNDTTVYILIDELSECINNIVKKQNDKAAKFLQWFRSKRNTMTRELRFLVSGSISFDRVVRPIGATSLSWINDFKRITVEGFPYDDALEFVKICFNHEGLRYNTNVGKKILKCLGEPYLPYFIAVFSSVIRQKQIGRTITEDIVDEMYNDDLLGVHGKGYFDYYKRRLGTYVEPLAKAAEEILKETSLVEDGYTVELSFSVFEHASGTNDHEMFIGLMADLENDFYVKIVDKRIHFQSKVLKDWWRRYYV